MNPQQFISLSLFVIPWLTIFLMDREKLKRFIPAALFTGVTSGIIYEIGIMLNFWHFKEVSFPLVMYGLLPIMLLWVLSFTYGKFWTYFIVNAVLDLGFAFVLAPIFSTVGILGINQNTGVYIYAINFIHAALIYGYQVWQEGSFPSKVTAR
ncbi:hypothetical protein [Paenibacillus thermotolerans]|uniref:hypothetical protein n=1 Tax=Paenibacillus thermotolerans TaxID=3027807 RepID=UPI0023674A0E|nr:MULTISPECIES: hypothetical protein [unclassified Paenibacillus]